MSLGVVAWKSAHLPKPGTLGCGPTKAWLHFSATGTLVLVRVERRHYVFRNIWLISCSCLNQAVRALLGCLPIGFRGRSISTCQACWIDILGKPETQCLARTAILLVNRKTLLMGDPSSSTTIRRHPALRRLLPDPSCCQVVEVLGMACEHLTASNSLSGFFWLILNLDFFPFSSALVSSGEYGVGMCCVYFPPSRSSPSALPLQLGKLRRALAGLRPERQENQGKAERPGYPSTQSW
ncbi:hypothetical protein B0T26DRAFT_456488 [Lasiosphaeria miniovina]|uniref:Uncharacterized protein n=1 Tax=Lasiosphaeria miniovina TaxID=1954250 RepID=A0AA40DKF6_9PEZI|nr:uncharacterized protein B0T26DRAFT_456488 [Lasiosphaeria miniovina]KAK0706475.1 hypothetical protein B0T26DRAFT_456488 [Lasiosphaeria miniovina]